ncbi:hypothetical protein SAY87_013492 [Trapa incisa]|uniref:SOSEKI DIX-like domain-containing protein n=1 Tax=Trapa incisa TaxID=236973 RepID=A0AAN7KF55_9MYRT|nr:hypothetical protein SAY87_013492 [Trapa incisa]
MEARMKKYQQVSPERAKVWTEKSPRYYQNRKVPVVYYLCRNRQLEHPHFIEVPLSSPEGLYLRDVIERLNVLRGRGMASTYSWSSKRNYKNGFVWHDLSEDDLILPSNGNEYVLKGSELFDESNSVAADHFSTVANIKMPALKQLPPPMSSRSLDDSSSSSSMNGKEVKQSQEDEQSSLLHPHISSGISPDSGPGRNSSWNGSLSLSEYKIHKEDGLADASTQTEETMSRCITGETCTRGVSTGDSSLDNEFSDTYQNKAPSLKDNLEIRSESVSPQPTSSSASSSGGKNDTLESLIRADASKINSFRILEEEEIQVPTNGRLKAANMLMQLISCGSISVKDNSFGLIPMYRPKFSPSGFQSPMFSTSMLLRELDCLSENPMMGLRLEDKEYFSGSLIETQILQKDRAGHVALKRSSSYNADRTCKSSDSAENDESDPGKSKCISLSIKLVKQPRSDSLRSPQSDKPRKSSGRGDSLRTTPARSNTSSRRITEPLLGLGDKQAKRFDSFREEEKVFKIEES